MITEYYVSFEVAKLLKDKGFDEHCIYVYLHNGDTDIWDADKEDIECTKPTQQMAMAWLREVHNLSPRPRYEEVEDEKELLHYLWFFDILSMKPYKMLIEPKQGYDTYEKAAEEAIKYCLEHLI